MQPKFIVGIGGSSGGLKAYSALFTALPSNTDANQELEFFGHRGTKPKKIGNG